MWEILISCEAGCSSAVVEFSFTEAGAITNEYRFLAGCGCLREESLGCRPVTFPGSFGSLVFRVFPVH